MKVTVRNISLYGIGTLLILALIGFASKKQSDRYINQLMVDISFEEGNYFIDTYEITDLVNAEHTDFVLGQTLSELQLKTIEERVEANAFVHEAQVYVDVKGNLQVEVQQAIPIARILGDRELYIDRDGNLLPLNTQHTARVPIIEFESGIPWEESLLETEEGANLLKLIRFIRRDPFWQVQIAHLVVDSSFEISMLTQVSKQEVLFGAPIDFEKKFKKLDLFYKEVLPNKGWNTYASVNVKFENQIVCK